MEDEIWKPVVGYENLYEVSDKGRIRSVGRIVNACYGSKMSLKGKILKPIKCTGGYLCIDLCKEGTKKRYLIHRLVAQAFIPNQDNLPCINHKDENPYHNNVDNLEYCTQKYNINYGTRTQRAVEKQRNHPNKSKKVYQYTLDNQLVKVWDSTMECQRNGFNNSNVGKCCRGEYKQHRGFRWSYTPLEAPNA